MADPTPDNDDTGLDISDDDAARLLDADNDDGDAPADLPKRTPQPAETDWKAEAEKWKRLSRQNEKTAKDTATKLKQYEDQGKSESQRLQEDRDQHRSRAEKAEAALRRREIAEQAAPEHATVAQIRAVAKRLSGDDDEALEADAAELFELIAPAPAVKTPQRPKERLRGGSEPEEPQEETDPAKLAALIPRRR